MTIEARCNANDNPKPIAAVFISRYMIRKYGMREAINRSIQKCHNVYKMNPDFSVGGKLKPKK
jgi:hypothetical protein